MKQRAERTLPARIRLRPGLGAGPATGGPARPGPRSPPRPPSRAPAGPPLPHRPSGLRAPQGTGKKAKTPTVKRGKKKKKSSRQRLEVVPSHEKTGCPSSNPGRSLGQWSPGVSYSRRPAGPRAPLPTSLSALSRGASARRFAAANSSPIPLHSLSTRIKNFFRKSIIAEKCQMNARANAPPEGLAEPPVPGRAEPTRGAPLEQRKVGKKETLFRFAGGFIWNADFSLQGHEQKATRLVSCYPVPARHGPAEVHCTGTSRPRPGTRAGLGGGERPGPGGTIHCWEIQSLVGDLFH